MTAIWKREMRNYFLTPIGYVFMGIFLLLGGLFFMSGNLYLGSGDPAYVFQSLSYLFMLIVPLLTMRLLSEERRRRTDQLLLTSPLPVRAIVLGKFFAAAAVFVCALGLTGSYIAIIGAYGKLYPGLILTNYLGFLLLGLCHIAVGLMVSATTQSQLSAAVLTFGANALLQFLESVGPALHIPGAPWLPEALAWLSLYRRYERFTAGVLSPADALYMLSFMGILLFLTVRIVDKRRWSEG